MRQEIRTVVMAAIMLASLSTFAADRNGFSLRVEMDGMSRPEYCQDGKVYIEAVRGRDYSLRITNPLPYRVAVALSVDGLNTINASHTSPGKAPKWILGPYESVVISGWQVNGSEARKFFFTGEKSSYGAFLGKTENLGNIEAVFYKEKQRHVTKRVQPMPCEPRREGSEYSKGRDSSGGIGSYDAPSSAPAPHMESQRKAEAESKSQSDLSNEYAATGIGERTDNQIEWVSLDLEKSPCATVKLRYEFRPQLVQLGIIPRDYCKKSPMDRRERGRGFDGNYCPEP